MAKQEHQIPVRPSKVSLYPSPSFLSKNQLVKEGPDSVALVVIPALGQTLDKSLKSDRSLCLVRALWYYLDRTSDLRQKKGVGFCILQERLRQRHLTYHPLPSHHLKKTCFLPEFYFSLRTELIPLFPYLRAGLKKGAGGNVGTLLATGLQVADL